MSFGMIFSIILIVFFLVVAFIAIKAFLGWKTCADVGLFFDGLDKNVKIVLSSTYANMAFNSSLPSSIEYVCFVNLSSSTSYNANNIEKDIWTFMKNNEHIITKDSNVYIYSKKSYSCGSRFKKINRIDVSQKSPNCIKVIGGRVSMMLERDTSSNSVRISG